MNDYFNAPSMCLHKSGGVLNYTCEHHARKTGGASVCLFKKHWERIVCGFNCPNKEWKNTREAIEKNEQSRK